MMTQVNTQYNDDTGDTDVEDIQDIVEEEEDDDDDDDELPMLVDVVWVSVDDAPVPAVEELPLLPVLNTSPPELAELPIGHGFEDDDSCFNTLCKDAYFNKHK